MKTTQLLRRLGIRSNYQGYYYILEALNAAAENPRILTHVTKMLYPVVARRCESTPAAVEHGIRTVINRSWEEGDRELLQKLAGCRLLYRPTNGEFLAILAEHVGVTDGNARHN